MSLQPNITPEIIGALGDWAKQSCLVANNNPLLTLETILAQPEIAKQISEYKRLNLAKGNIQLVDPHLVEKILLDFNIAKAIDYVVLRGMAQKAAQDYERHRQEREKLKFLRKRLALMRRLEIQEKAMQHYITKINQINDQILQLIISYPETAMNMMDYYINAINLLEQKIAAIDKAIEANLEHYAHEATESLCNHFELEEDTPDKRAELTETNKELIREKSNLNRVQEKIKSVLSRKSKAEQEKAELIKQLDERENALLKTAQAAAATLDEEDDADLAALKKRRDDMESEVKGITNEIDELKQNFDKHTEPDPAMPKVQILSIKRGPGLDLKEVTKLVIEETKVESIKTRVEEINERIEAKTKRKLQLLKEINKVKKEIDKKEEALAALKKKKASMPAKKYADKKARLYDELKLQDTKISELRAKIEAKDHEILALEDENEHLQAQKVRLDEKIKDLYGKVAGFFKKTTSKKELQEHLDKKIAPGVAINETLTAGREQCVTDLQKLKSEAATFSQEAKTTYDGLLAKGQKQGTTVERNAHFDAKCLQLEQKIEPDPRPAASFSTPTV